MYVSMKDMMLIHFLIGVVFTIFAVLHSNKKNKTRKLFNFGEGFLGEQKKWIQWYSWSLTFEIITSFLYMHTQLLYIELAMSFFEAGAVVVGAFIVDRLIDFFTGNSESKVVLPELHLSEHIETIKNKINETVEKTKVKPTVVDPIVNTVENDKKIKDDFDKLIKGH